jgi:indolepyruvate ferredoxin oxidoreductase, alpha subunit
MGGSMKDLGEMLLRREPFRELVMGNTAIVRAMVEAGVRAVTSYPGSPTPEMASAIERIPADLRPFYFEFSVNEKVATEVAFGAAVDGHLSTVFFKSVGLNVAADTFVQLNHMDLAGGMVVVLGDDPGANSSQNEQDNRHLAMMSYTPVLEPSSPSEMYSYFLKAAGIAARRRMAVILRLTTHVCHAKEMVDFDGWSGPATVGNAPFDDKEGAFIPIGANVARMKRRAMERLEGLAEESAALASVHPGGGGRGVITSGFAFLSLTDAVAASRAAPDILKLGMVYPVPRRTIIDFLREHGEVLVLEELDDILERTVKAIAFEEGLDTIIRGKACMEDWIGEYTPGRVRSIISALWPDAAPPPPPAASADPVPARFPQLCPGCGHRSAFHAIRKALGENAISVGDVGCHTLGFLPPYRVGQLMMCMGASTAIGQGLRLFDRKREVVTLMGDSTFFHAGLPGVVNAVFNRHDLTMILMENGTTAMTGHQDHPGSGRNFSGESEALLLRKVLEGLGVSFIREVDTYSQAKLTEAIREALDAPGFSVVIARHPCMLKFTRGRKKKAGYVQQHVRVDQDACRLIRECIDEFGCPSFERDPETAAVSVNADLCIGDGSCISTCPAKAIIPGGGAS